MKYSMFMCTNIFFSFITFAAYLFLMIKSKFIYIIATILGLTNVLDLSCKNGDSTVAISHNNVLIRTNPNIGFTQYANWVKLGDASKTYSKVIADLSMECPPNENCGEWDYLNFIYVRKRKGTYTDTPNAEIMRFITPYGKYWTSAQKWQHNWRWDLTDFASFLTDSCEIVYEHSGFETNVGRGWIINLKFTLIEGPVAKKITECKQIFRAGVSFDSAHRFAKATPPISVNVKPKSKNIKFKVIQTGHGMDNTENCSEFCAKKRFMYYNDKLIGEDLVWRNNCGLNPLYPQFGTWLYDRAGWCPGAEVTPVDFETTIDNTGTHSVNLDMEEYNAKGWGANYVITIWQIEYEENTVDLDAELYDVVSPTADKRYLRDNPMCSGPKVSVKNNGKQTINSLEFEYGLALSAKNTHTLTNLQIKTGETKTLELPYFGDWSKGNQFVAKITKTNGSSTDENPMNNAIATPISAAMPPVLPSEIIVLHRTNNAPSENAFTIFDASNKIFYQRKSYPLGNTVYRDTIRFYNGCFTFVFTDTGAPPSGYPLNKDGINFWANTFDGTGSLQIRNRQGALLTLPQDFGTEYRLDFTVGYALSSPNTTTTATQVRLFPNPAKEELYLDLVQPGNPTEKCSIFILDINGKVIKSEARENSFSALQVLNISNLQTGNYFIKVIRKNQITTLPFVKL